MSRPWTEAEIQLLGTQPDFDIGRLIGRPGKAVWAKRQSLGIGAPATMLRRWTAEEDRVVLSKPVSESAKLLNRTETAIGLRRNKLLKRLTPGSLIQPPSPDSVQLPIQVPRYDSPEQEEKVQFVGGPYTTPTVPVGGWLQCEVRGLLQVGGYSNALIPWPTAARNRKQLIVCGDLLKALKTESRLAVAFHFGISTQMVSGFRRALGIERLTAGSTRLFWRNVRLAGSDEARAKMSRQREGREDLMTPEDRARLREIQSRPKSEAWKERAAERWQRRYLLSGKPDPWTDEDLKLIGTLPDREVAKLLNRSLHAVKAKKFQLRKENPG